MFFKNSHIDVFTTMIHTTGYSGEYFRLIHMQTSALARHNTQPYGGDFGFSDLPPPKKRGEQTRPACKILRRSVPPSPRYVWPNQKKNGQKANLVPVILTYGG